jgi:hypothetical protein
LISTLSLISQSRPRPSILHSSFLIASTRGLCTHLPD